MTSAKSKLQISCKKPEPGKQYPIFLGSSFYPGFGRDPNVFVTLRYNFKPSSIDQSQPGDLKFDKQSAFVKFPTQQDDKTQTFKGVASQASDQDFLIWFDAQKQCMVLEKVSVLVKSLKPHRENTKASFDKKFLESRQTHRQRMKDIATKKKSKRPKRDAKRKEKENLKDSRSPSTHSHYEERRASSQSLSHSSHSSSHTTPSLSPVTKRLRRKKKNDFPRDRDSDSDSSENNILLPNPRALKRKKKKKQTYERSGGRMPSSSSVSTTSTPRSLHTPIPSPVKMKRRTTEEELFGSDSESELENIRMDRLQTNPRRAHAHAPVPMNVPKPLPLHSDEKEQESDAPIASTTVQAAHAPQALSDVPRPLTLGGEEYPPTMQSSDDSEFFDDY